MPKNSRATITIVFLAEEVECPSIIRCFILSSNNDDLSENTYDVRAHARVRPTMEPHSFHRFLSSLCQLVPQFQPIHVRFSSKIELDEITSREFLSRFYDEVSSFNGVTLRSLSLTLYSRSSPIDNLAALISHILVICDSARLLQAPFKSPKKNFDNI